MWTDITRKQVAREGLRLPSDLTDAEWAVLEPLLPPRARRGRPPLWGYREIVEALLYLLRGGLPWRMLPPGVFPPMTTVQHYFYLWRDMGVWPSINHALVMMAREAEGREASPSAGVIDSQSVKTTEAGGPRGFDAGKKITGRKRHILTDTQGLLVGAVIHAADIQDRDGAPDLLAGIGDSFPWLRHVFADGAYAGAKLAAALAKLGRWTLEIIKRSDHAKGFEVLPRRWVVERTPHPEPVEGRLARPQPPPRQGLRTNHPERHRVALHGLRPTPHPPNRSPLISLRRIMSQTLSGLRPELTRDARRNSVLTTEL